MSLYYNKKLISGVRDVPSMTLAQYNALTNKPKLWERTDAPDSDRGINADDIEYSNGVSVKDEIDTKVGGWIYLGEKTGTAEHSLPTGWKELLLQVNVNQGNLVTYHIYNVQTDNYTNTSLGNYGTSYAVGQVSRTKAKISTVNWAGSDVTSSAKLYAYYR